MMRARSAAKSAGVHAADVISSRPAHVLVWRYGADTVTSAGTGLRRLLLGDVLDPEVVLGDVIRLVVRHRTHRDRRVGAVEIDGPFGECQTLAGLQQFRARSGRACRQPGGTGPHAGTPSRVTRNTRKEI